MTARHGRRQITNGGGQPSGIEEGCAALPRGPDCVEIRWRRVEDPPWRREGFCQARASLVAMASARVDSGHGWVALEARAGAHTNRKTCYQADSPSHRSPGADMVAWTSRSSRPCHDVHPGPAIRLPATQHGARVALSSITRQLRSFLRGLPHFVRRHYSTVSSTLHSLLPRYFERSQALQVWRALPFEESSECAGAELPLTGPRRLHLLGTCTACSFTGRMRCIFPSRPCNPPSPWVSNAAAEQRSWPTETPYPRPVWPVLG